MAIYTRTTLGENVPDREFKVKLTAYRKDMSNRERAYLVLTFTFPQYGGSIEHELTLCSPEGTTTPKLLALLRKALKTKNIDWREEEETK